MSYIDELRAKQDPETDAGEDVHNWMLDETCRTVDALRLRCQVLRAALNTATFYVSCGRCACEHTVDGDEYICQRCRILETGRQALSGFDGPWT